MKVSASKEKMKEAYLKIIDNANPRYENGKFLFDGNYFVREVRETYLAIRILKYDVNKPG